MSIWFKSIWSWNISQRQNLNKASQQKRCANNTHTTNKESHCPHRQLDNSKMYTIQIIHIMQLATYKTIHLQQLSHLLRSQGFWQCWSESQGEFLVQKSIQGHAAEMGCKISLPLWQWLLIQWTWYKHGSYFQNFLKYAQFDQSDTKISVIAWKLSSFGKKC